MKKFAPLFVVIAASLWAVDGILLRPSLYALPVSLVVFLESTLVALVLTPVLGKNLRSLHALETMDWLAFVGVALAGGVVGTLSITRALFYVNFVNLSVVMLIQKLQPAFALLMASLLLRERLPRIFFAWAALAMLGAYLMTFGLTAPNLNTGDKTLQAALFALLAAFSFGCSTIFSKRALKHVTFQTGTYLRFLISACILFLVVLLNGNIFEIRQVSEPQWLTIFIIVLTIGGPGIFLYYYGLQRIPASVATICELALPLTAVLLEYVLRDNILSGWQWLGVFMLFGSMMRASRFKPIHETEQAA